jgi:hypothetical protein
MYDEARGIGVELLNVGDLLAKRVPYRIPIYQRGYAWEEDEVKDFLDDLLSLRDKVIDEGDDSTASHFFGGLLTVDIPRPGSETGHVLEVVDGQQRLSTFFLTLGLVTRAYLDVADEAETAGDETTASAAKEDADEEDRAFVSYSEKDDMGRRHRRIRIRLSRVDGDFYAALITGTKVTPTANSHGLLLHAAGAIRDRIVAPIVNDDDSSPSEKLDQLRLVRKCLTDRCYAIHTTSSNRTEAYRLFAVLNDRGKSLSEGDLLRTRTMELLEGRDDLQAEAEQQWARILTNKPEQVLGFLRSYYSSVTGNRPPSKDLYDGFRIKFLSERPEDVDDTIAASIIDRVTGWAAECVTYLRLTSGDWPYDPSTVAKWDMARLTRLVKVLRQEAAIPLLMSLVTAQTQEFFASAVGILERAAFRYNLSGGHSGSYGEMLFVQAQAARDHHAGYGLDALRTAITPLILKSAPSSSFRSALDTRFRYDTATRGVMKHFLTTLDDYAAWWQRGADGDPSPARMHDWDLGQIEIEHVYPQRPKAGERVDSLDPFTHMIGNLTIWAPGDNRAASNDRFELKKPNYATSQSQLTQSLGHLDDWTNAERLARQADMIDLAVRVFNVDGLVESPATVAGVTPELVGSETRRWFVQQNDDSIYRDSDGELYDYPYGIANAQRIAVGDMVVCYVAARHAPDGRRITGIGRVDRIVGDGDRLLAVYDRYFPFAEALTFDQIGGDPRSNQRNAINPLPEDAARLVIAEAGVSSLDDLPNVTVDVEAVLARSASPISTAEGTGTSPDDASATAD